jgi:hypothetical protein
MQIVISFPPGFSVDGIVMSADAGMLRVAVRGWDDAAIFRARAGGWVAENGDFVEIQPPPSCWMPAHAVENTSYRSSLVN